MTQETDRANPNPPVDRLSQLWRRVHDHKIAQWSVAYIAVAYAFQHGVVLTSEAFEWPEAVLRVSMLLLILGLPVVMTLAWYHGERASRHFSAAELTIISILLVVGSVIFYAAVQPRGETAAGPVQRGVEAARAAATSPRGAVSIAVLPFANLSGDAAQEFFSDGITEEITSALAKVPDLRVVGRTSAFQFKSQNQDLRAIGQSLAATHLIEGSVRKAGDRVRITAQLINAADGTHIWSEDYDRQLTDIFAVQEEIARAITTSLRMPLGLKPGENLVNSRNIDQESYQQYLRAKALYQGRLGGGGVKAVDQAIALLEQVLARNPNYAPAWVLLASTYNTRPNYSGALSAFRTISIEEVRQEIQSTQSKAEAAARKAIQLDESQSGGYRILASVQTRAGKFVQGEELHSKALSLDPNGPETLSSYSNFLVTVGRVKEALPVSKQVLELEPFIPINNRDMALVLWMNGQDDAAIEILRKIAGNANLIALLQASGGRYKEAADTVSSGPLGGAIPVPEDVRQEAVRLLRLAPAKVPSPQNVKRLGGFDWVYLYVGAPGQALEYFEFYLQIGWVNVANRLLSHPTFGPARKTERYKAYARKAGLVDYWRAKGWPEFCHPTTGDDFECT